MRLEKVASDLSGSIETPDDLQGAMKALGQNCQSCHGTYRIKK